MIMVMRFVAIALLVLAACGTTESAEPLAPGHDADSTPEPVADAAVPADASQDAPADASHAAPDASTPGSDAAMQQDATAPADAAATAADASVQQAPDAAQQMPCREWWRDADGDGFGAGVPVVSCSQPDGYVANNMDCYDANAKAYPGQRGQFRTHRGDGSFDYDCDGVAKPFLAKMAKCPVLDNSCPPPNHWPAGFSCDYSAISAAVEEARNGWTPYLAPSCVGGKPCPPYAQPLPKCGETGQWGLSITWDATAHEYDCKDVAYDDPAKAGSRQTCN
jgi:hypothetical protein